MPHDPQEELRIRAAWIYYVEGRTQSEVAQTLGINRVSVTRLLSAARKRGEVSIGVESPLTKIVELERKFERRFGLKRTLIAPWPHAEGDPTRVIASRAGRYISQMLASNMTVGVGWGRTLHATLDFLEGRAIRNLRVISLLGGITEARRFNPAEFAWQFAERFDAEGFLVPAPALVDSPQTKHALLERCGLDQVFQLAEASDVAFLSCGAINSLTTSYRLGHLTEAERNAIQDAGAVGDVLYNFLDAEGQVIDHSINARIMSIGLERLQRVRERVLISGGQEKTAIILAALRGIRPTALITDEATARALLANEPPQQD